MAVAVGLNSASRLKFSMVLLVLGRSSRLYSEPDRNRFLELLLLFIQICFVSILCTICLTVAISSISTVKAWFSWESMKSISDSIELVRDSMLFS